MSPQLLNTDGLIVNLIGVVLLFRYGMPFRVKTGGAMTLEAEQIDPSAKAVEALHIFLGYAGLALIVIGTGLQVWAIWR